MLLLAETCFCLYIGGMTNSFRINVTRSTFRLHGTAEYKGSTYKFMGKTMSDFDEAIVEGFLSMDADRVELVTDVPTDVSDSLAALTDLRAQIEGLLGQRQEAYVTALEALESAGWTRKDAARMVGANPNSLPSILDRETGASVYGASMLNGEPAALSDGVLVLGAWERNGTELTRVEDERVAGLSAQVMKLWAEARAKIDGPAEPDTEIPSTTVTGQEGPDGEREPDTTAPDSE